MESSKTREEPRLQAARFKYCRKHHCLPNADRCRRDTPPPSDVATSELPRTTWIGDWCRLRLQLSRGLTVRGARVPLHPAAHVQQVWRLVDEESQTGRVDIDRQVYDTVRLRRRTTQTGCGGDVTSRDDDLEEVAVHAQHHVSMGQIVQGDLGAANDSKPWG